MQTDSGKKHRNAFIAGVATLGVIGLGQLYNAKLRKAAAMYILWLIAVAFLIFAPVVTSFTWLLTALALPVIVGLIALVDAIRDAVHLREVELHSYNRWYVYLSILLINGLVVSQLLVGLATQSYRAYKIPTQSMSPTIEMGDAMIADMKAYRKSHPSRGDLIVFNFPLNESIPYVKRLIGLPGEEIEIRNRTVYINGQPLKEDYVQYLDPGSTNEHFGPLRIPPSQFFVLGDSRDNSQDSRYWGTVKQSQILGQARYVYWAKDRSRIGKRLK